MSTAKRGGGRRAIAAVLAVGALGVLFSWRGGPRSAPAEPQSTGTGRAEHAPAMTDEPTGAAPAQSVTITTHAPAVLPATGAPSLAVLQQSLADYLAVSAYPPWSHPHSEGTADKLKWNDPIADDLPWDDRPG